MSDIEIRITIAKIRGWTGVRMSLRSEFLTDTSYNDYCGIRPGHTQETWREVLPDYPNDLNQMYEVAGDLSEADAHRMTGHLLMILGESNRADIAAFTAVRRANARQLAQAFLLTHDAWDKPTVGDKVRNERWFFIADWCRKRGVSPMVRENYDRAAAEWAFQNAKLP